MALGGYSINGSWWFRDAMWLNLNHPLMGHLHETIPN